MERLTALMAQAEPILERCSAVDPVDSNPLATACHRTGYAACSPGLKKKTMAVLRIPKKMVRLASGDDSRPSLDKRTGGWLGMLAAQPRSAKTRFKNTPAAIAYFAIFLSFLHPPEHCHCQLNFGSSVDPHLIVQRLEFIAAGPGPVMGQI